MGTSEEERSTAVKTPPEHAARAVQQEGEASCRSTHEEEAIGAADARPSIDAYPDTPSTHNATRGSSRARGHVIRGENRNGDM
ncbi:hypothetical protein MRX96_034753 [Rhipicephalus microplus]